MKSPASPAVSDLSVTVSQCSLVFGVRECWRESGRVVPAWFASVD